MVACPNILSLPATIFFPLPTTTFPLCPPQHFVFACHNLRSRPFHFACHDLFPLPVTTFSLGLSPFPLSCHNLFPWPVTFSFTCHLFTLPLTTFFHCMPQSFPFACRKIFHLPAATCSLCLLHPFPFAYHNLSPFTCCNLLPLLLDRLAGLAAVVDPFTQENLGTVERCSDCCSS